MTYELKLEGGRVVIWSGNNPLHAIANYIRAHAGAKIAAWRAQGPGQSRKWHYTAPKRIMSRTGPKPLVKGNIRGNTL